MARVEATGLQSGGGRVRLEEGWGVMSDMHVPCPYLLGLPQQQLIEETAPWTTGPFLDTQEQIAAM
jgi:hypothetical protein